MPHHISLVSLIFALNCALVYLLPLSDDAAGILPFVPEISIEDISDETETISDFLKNVHDSKDVSMDRDHSLELDGHDSQVTDFLENMFGNGRDNVDRRSSDNDHTDDSKEPDDSKDKEHDSSKDKDQDNSRDKDNDNSKDKDHDNSRDKEHNSSKDKDQDNSRDKDNDNSKDKDHDNSKDKDSNNSKDNDNSKDGDQDNSKDKDHDNSKDDDTCPADSVEISDHQLTVTTANGCKVVIKLDGITNNKQFNVQDDKLNDVRTILLSYDD